MLTVFVLQVGSVEPDKKLPICAGVPVNGRQNHVRYQLIGKQHVLSMSLVSRRLKEICNRHDSLIVCGRTKDANLGFQSQ